MHGLEIFLSNIDNISNLIYLKLNQIDFALLSVVISGLAQVLIGVVITIFVLSVTLLKRAAKLANEEKAASEQTNKAEFDDDIAALKKRLGDKPDDIDALKKQIEDLETKRDYNKKQLIQLQKKYDALGLKESVLMPGGFFLLSLIFGNWIIRISDSKFWGLFSFVFAATSLVYGIKKILFTLKSVSEVSLNAENSQPEQLQAAVTQALKAIDKEKEPKPFIKFNEKSPFIFKPNSEGVIEFKIQLLSPGNDEAKNVDVWFLSSDGIQLLKNGASGEPFKQGPSYPIPNANTIRYQFPLVRRHTLTADKLKIKTLGVGEYKLRYKADCDNHVESASADREIGIVVQE